MEPLARAREFFRLAGGRVAVTRGGSKRGGASHALNARPPLFTPPSFATQVLETPLLSDLSVMRQPQPLPDGPWQFWTGSVESAIELWTDLLFRGPRAASETGWSEKL